MNDQDRLVELSKRLTALESEADEIRAEIEEIEERRFPKQKRPIFTLIKGGAVAAAIAAGFDKVRKHPGISGAAMMGGALSGALILGQIYGDDGEVVSDPPRAPGVLAPWTLPPEVPPKTPGLEPRPSATGGAPASPGPLAPGSGVQVQDPLEEPNSPPEGGTTVGPEPTPVPPEPEPTPSETPSQPPEPSPSPTVGPPPESPSPTPTPSPTPSPPPVAPAEPEYLLCVEADLSAIELSLCLLELGS